MSARLIGRLTRSQQRLFHSLSAVKRTSTKPIVHSIKSKQSIKCFTASSHSINYSAPGHVSALQKQEEELLEKIGQSSKLSDHLVEVRTLVQVFMAQSKVSEAETLLWRLINEQTGPSAKPIDTVNGLLSVVHSLSAVLNVMRAAGLHGHAEAGTQSSDEKLLIDLLDRYQTASSVAQLSSDDSQSVLNHPLTFSFLTTLSRSFLDIGLPERAASVLEQTLCFDEADHPPRSAEDHTIDPNALRLAMAFNLKGILAYHPPEHVHGESCATHGHDSYHAELAAYDWSESASDWAKAIAYCAPFIGKLKAGEIGAVEEDSIEMHYVRMLGMIADNLARAQFTSNHHAQATQTLSDTLVLLELAVSPSHIEAMRVREHLIAMHYELQQIHEAEAQIKHIIQLDPRMVSVEAATVIDRLAQMAFQMKNYPLAGSLFQQCIAIREAVSSEPSIETAARYNDLGMCEIRCKEWKLAETHLKQSISMKEGLVGADHPDLAVSVHNLATAQMGAHKLGEAEQTFARAEKLYTAKMELAQSSKRDRMLEEARMSLAMLHSHKSVLFKQLKRFDESAHEIQQTLAIKRQVLGPEHPAVTPDLSHLGTVLLEAKKFDEAIKIYEELVSIAKKNHGENHVNFAISKHLLSRAQSGAGHTDDALRTIREAVQLIEKLQHSANVPVQAVDLLRNNLAVQLEAAGHADEAQSIRKKMVGQ